MLSTTVQASPDCCLSNLMVKADKHGSILSTAAFMEVLEDNGDMQVCVYGSAQTELEGIFSLVALHEEWPALACSCAKLDTMLQSGSVRFTIFFLISKWFSVSC
jgi:hypothetical protein